MALIYRGDAMANGIEIMGFEIVTDPDTPRGTKMVAAYSVANSALINDILTRYPGTGGGSVVMAPGGVFKVLIDGVWQDWS